MQVFSAKLIGCGMINIVSNSGVSRTRIPWNLAWAFCLYFSNRSWKIDGQGEVPSQH